MLLFVLGTMPVSAKTTTALHVETSNRPYAVFGSDGREHAEYDLVLTNAFTGAATLSAVSVRADGKPALTLAGDGLVAATHTLLTSDATATIAPASTAFTQVDLVRRARPAARRRSASPTASPTRSPPTRPRGPSSGAPSPRRPSCVPTRVRRW